jgi:hypothetical protein
VIFTKRQGKVCVEPLHVLVGGGALEDRDVIGSDQKIAHAQGLFADDRRGDAITVLRKALRECKIGRIVVAFFAGDRENEKSEKK